MHDSYPRLRFETTPARRWPRIASSIGALAAALAIGSVVMGAQGSAGPTQPIVANSILGGEVVQAQSQSEVGAASFVASATPSNEVPAAAQAAASHTATSTPVTAPTSTPIGAATAVISAPLTTTTTATPQPSAQSDAPIAVTTPAPASTAIPTLTPTMQPTATPTATSSPAPTATSTPVTSQAVPSAPGNVSLTDLEKQMFDAHNVERRKAGLPELSLDASAQNVARARAQDMATKGYFSHTSPTGQTAFTLLKAAGVTYAWAGENIAVNTYSDAQTVTIAMTGFMNSEGHRENILNTHYSRVGIGVATAGTSKYYAVVFLGY